MRKRVEVSLCKLLNKEAFDHNRSDLRYGTCCLYTFLIPREVILETFCREDLAQEKGMMEEFPFTNWFSRTVSGRKTGQEQRSFSKNVLRKKR